MKLSIQNSDTIGAFSTSLCALHCVATPFLFIAQAQYANQFDSAQVFWSSLDYLFLLISFFAVYQSTKKTTGRYIKPLFWLSWFSLFALIMNEKLELFHLPETLTYISAFSLVAIHLYNRKYCRCDSDSCCADTKSSA